MPGGPRALRSSEHIPWGPTDFELRYFLIAAATDSGEMSGRRSECTYGCGG